MKCRLTLGLAWNGVEAVPISGTCSARTLDASSYYEGQAAGLGVEFLEVVSPAINLLCEPADLGAPHRAGTRRFVLPRFPYGLVYADEPTFVLLGRSASPASSRVLDRSDLSGMTG
jgi:hypothetical protein